MPTIALDILSFIQTEIKNILVCVYFPTDADELCNMLFEARIDF